MRLRIILTTAHLLVAPLAVPDTLAAQAVPTPESVLGFAPGADRHLVEWPVLVDYFRQLAAASDRVEYRELGTTTLGAPFIALVISSAENIARIDELREINQRLADPRRITSAQERERLLREGKTIVLITSSIHSTEVGGHFAPVVIADRLARADSPDIRAILDDVVLLLVPTLNPDGVSIVARWYQQTLGTPAEGTSPPELYHHYVGHDNNRDWYAFTQVETQLTVDSLHNVWHPQIVHDIHQMGGSGARIFFPPFIDPFEPNVDPILVEGYAALGTSMAWTLTGQGKQGVVTAATYDAWTPARAYQHYHGGVRILSETASAQLATPVTLTADDISPRGRGFNPREASWNYPDPWMGGDWTLGDIVDYMTSGAFALLAHAAAHRDVWLRNFLGIGERAVRGWERWPYAYAIPAHEQNDVALGTMLGILQRGAVEIRTARAEFSLDGMSYPVGTYVVVLRQPYAAFAKALLERQDYPDLRLYPGGPPREPYDVTAHTLPLLMGVRAIAVEDSLAVPLSEPVRVPAVTPHFDAEWRRVGLYRSFTASMDEGWTRWIFDTWNVPYRSVDDAFVTSGRLGREVDVVVIPDMRPSSIVEGLGDRYPEGYRGGLGTDGIAALRTFVEGGGTLLAFNDATAFAIEAFDLPVRDALQEVASEAFYAPGTLFRLDLDGNHALARGMSATVAAWFQEGPAFEVTDTARATVVGRWAERPADLLMSGWVLGPEAVAGRAALVEVRMGRGRVILYGFRPQYRAQSLATFPLLFNALAR